MTTEWRPDICVNGQCVITIAGVLSSVDALCGRHQAIKDALGLTNLQIFRVILFSCRRKERAKEETRLEMALGEEQTILLYRPVDVLRMTQQGIWPPPTPYVRLELDGGFRLVTGLTGAALTALQTRIANALALEETESGVTAITVE